MQKHVYNKKCIPTGSGQKQTEKEVFTLNKKEVLEIKKRFKKESCTFTRVCGCYVNSEHNRVTQFGKTFLNLEEEELFKYLELAQKVLSGTLGNHLLELEFPLEEETQGQKHQFLLGLRESRLKNENLLDRFYDLVIENYDDTGNYLILLFHDAYDIPMKTKDNRRLDESEEIYEYVLCAICPVTLSKPGLSYLEDANEIVLRFRDWIVGIPDTGFLFPTFTDRSADIHSTMFYTKNPKEPPIELIENVLGCAKKMTATEQRNIFSSILEHSLGEQCNYDTIREIHDKIQEKLSEQSEEDVDSDPNSGSVELSKNDIKEILADSGVCEEKLLQAEAIFEEKVGNDILYAENVLDRRKFEVKTYDVVLHVKPEKASQIRSQIIDGKKCLLIPMDENENVNVNGIHTTI